MFKPMTRVIAIATMPGVWKKGDWLLCLGEIQNMQGHVAVVDPNGKVLVGYHDDNFREVMDDD